MCRPATVALVTARARPEVHVDHDMPLLHPAVMAAGVKAEVTAWDDPAVDWSSFDLAVIRSPWDYSWRSAEFLRWAEMCARQTSLVNPLEVVRWNSNKGYLRELRDHQVPVVSTRYIRPGEAIELPADYEYVVKPAIGGGARFCGRYQPGHDELARAHVRHLHSEGTAAMVQPYLHQIESSGERALVFIQGVFQHAIRKNAVLANGGRYDEDRDAHPGTIPWTPTPEELSVAQQALSAAPFPADMLLYARVDMIGDPGSVPTITELELIEPSLYLRFHPESVEPVARVIAERAEQARATAAEPAAELSGVTPRRPEGSAVPR